MFPHPLSHVDPLPHVVISCSCTGILYCVVFLSAVTLYHGETLQLMVNRWGKLEKDFKLKNGQFDISKIPDIYDCIKYDLLHNRWVWLGVPVAKCLDLGVF